MRRKVLIETNRPRTALKAIATTAPAVYLQYCDQGESQVYAVTEFRAKDSMAGEF